MVTIMSQGDEAQFHFKNVFCDNLLNQKKYYKQEEGEERRKGMLQVEQRLAGTYLHTSAYGRGLASSSDARALLRAWEGKL